MKEVNEELESDPPRWCSEHGRWDCDEHGERCQHGNLIDDGCDKCEATTQWFDEKGYTPISDDYRKYDPMLDSTEFSARGNNAGGEDVCLPALSPAPLQSISPMDGVINGPVKAESNKQGHPSCSGCPTLLLDYPAWRMSFSAYGQHLGLEVPA